MNRKIEVAPSILSANFCSLAEDIKKAEEAGADRIHCDIMDGHFVPNITFGPLVVAVARKTTRLPLDVHLMIANPEKYIERFRDAGADVLMVHAEVCPDLPRILEQIKRTGARAGVTVNPDAPVDLFVPHLDLVDQVLIMTVYAGFGGQKFMPEMMTKVKAVKAVVDKNKYDVDIEVDGGLNDKTVKDAVSAGANVIVAGSYVFGSPDYKERINSLRIE